MLIPPRPEEYSISQIVRDLKEPVAQQFVLHWRKTAPWKLKLMKARQGQREVHRLWQTGGGFDRNLTDHDVIAQAITYIEWNPVRRGYVSEPEQWKWSSAQARRGIQNVSLGIDEAGTVFPRNGRELRKP